MKVNTVCKICPGPWVNASVVFNPRWMLSCCFQILNQFTPGLALHGFFWLSGASVSLDVYPGLEGKRKTYSCCNAPSMWAGSPWCPGISAVSYLCEEEGLTAAAKYPAWRQVSCTPQHETEDLKPEIFHCLALLFRSVAHTLQTAYGSECIGFDFKISSTTSILHFLFPCSPPAAISFKCMPTFSFLHPSSPVSSLCCVQVCLAHLWSSPSSPSPGSHCCSMDQTSGEKCLELKTKQLFVSKS